MRRFPDGPSATAPSEAELVTSRRGHFWVCAEPAEPARGPMFVQWEAPAEVTRPYPIVLVHGGGGQGLDWLGTPDGRPGWNSLLVAQGWVVYVVDRPGHGRSPYVPEQLGPMGPPLPVGVMAGIFRPTADGPGAVPFAHLHTQWPGDRHDPTDLSWQQFLASGGPFAADPADRQALEQERLTQLLDRIGPAFVVGNSLGGPAAFLLAESRPNLVVGLAQLEPVGPAFSPMFGPGTLQWGVAAVPMRFEPPVSTLAELDLVEGPPIAPGLPPVMMQREPARRLANLAQVPIAVISAEASVFRATNGPLVDFLRQAGCDAEHIDLAEHSVRGNSHGAMFERNNADVLAVVTGWFDGLIETAKS